MFDWSKLAASIPADHLATIQRVVRRPSVQESSGFDGLSLLSEADVAIAAWHSLCETSFEDEPLKRSWPSMEVDGPRRTDDPRFETVVQSIVRYGSRAPLGTAWRRTQNEIVRTSRMQSSKRVSSHT